MPGEQIRLLALDGGGVRGLSSLIILRKLMETVDPEAPPKPCEYFDMIGGTSTGGLIAVMLGRLQMTVDECIEAYTSLSDRVFEKKAHRIKINGQLQGRFDSAELERAIKQIVQGRGLSENTLLRDVDAPCKVFVCAASKQTAGTVCLASYRSPRSDNSDLLNSTEIWQACRATSAATTFFDPIAIGPYGEEFVDGALGENNPVYMLWNQAQDVFGAQLQAKLKCLVSIGTGVPSLKPVRDDALGIVATLKTLATETETTARRFRSDKSNLDDEGRYYRFNVEHGLETIGLHESKKKKEIVAATRLYVESPPVFKQMKACANNLAGREYSGPYRTLFSLQGVPVSNNFVPRPSVTAELERCLLLRPRSQRPGRRVFVLHGLGGIGKTQLAVDFARRYQDAFSSIFWLDGRSEDRLKQSIAGYAIRIPEGQIPNRSRKAAFNSEDDLRIAVADVLDWLARPDNVNWLLIFDNVDLDHEQGGTTGAFDVRRYLPGDHGAVLITSRLSRLAQLGDATHLRKADKELSKAIFQKWRGAELVLDEAGTELLERLDGLPLALAQAAAYLRETELDTATYVRLYKQQWDELMRSRGDSGSPLLDYEQRSVGTTWELSLGAIEARSQDAANLVRLWAFLDNRDLWHGLFAAVADVDEELRRANEQWYYDLASDETRFLDAVRLLLRYSLIEARESGQGSYMMHPVVHRWSAHIQDGPKKREFLRLALVAVGMLVPENDTKDFWVLQRRLLPHAERCSSWLMEMCEPSTADQVFNDVPVIMALYMLGILYYIQGRPNDALAIYERTLKAVERLFGHNHETTFSFTNNLGLFYIEMGRYEEAETTYERTLRGEEKLLGPHHELTLGTVSNLGLVYSCQGRLDEAEEMSLRVLRAYEQSQGAKHSASLEPINNLGVVYWDQGRFDEAEAMYERALERYEKEFGLDHPWALEIVHNLGLLYATQGRHGKAEVMYRQALEGFQIAFGASHPSYKIAMDNLEHLLQRQASSTTDESSSLQPRKKSTNRVKEFTTRLAKFLKKTSPTTKLIKDETWARSGLRPAITDWHICGQPQEAAKHSVL